MICPGTDRECDARACRYGGCQGRMPERMPERRPPKPASDQPS